MYVIDRYTSGNELEPNMTTRATVYQKTSAKILKIPPVLANNRSEQYRLVLLSACSDGGIQTSSSSQASVYNGFDLCTVEEGFQISR